MQNKINGIQIIGTQRSGSNLLRVMLDQSDEIVAPHPPHILSTFIPLMHLYDVQNERSYFQLVDDVLRFINANPVPWHNISFDKDEILALSVKKNLYELFKIIYELAAKCKGATYWCCKSMVNVHYANEFEAQGVNPKYIFLYRDGRDMAVSFKNTVVGEKHAYHLAIQWKRDQEACLKLKENVDASRFYSLRYEDLITEPEKNMRLLCEFLAVSYNDNMLQYYSSPSSHAAAASGKMWTNLTKPIISNNSGKFLTELAYDELEVFELVAGDTLRKLGYKTVTSCTNYTTLSQNSIERYDHENRILKKNIQSKSQEDLEKRKKQALILNAIQNRSYQTVQQIVL